MKNKLTVKDVARIAEMPEGSVYRWIEAGKLKCRRTPGNRIWFTTEDVEAALSLDPGTIEQKSTEKIS